MFSKLDAFDLGSISTLALQFGLLDGVSVFLFTCVRVGNVRDVVVVRNVNANRCHSNSLFTLALFTPGINIRSQVVRRDTFLFTPCITIRLPRFSYDISRLGFVKQNFFDFVPTYIMS